MKREKSILTGVEVEVELKDALAEIGRVARGISGRGVRLGVVVCEDGGAPAPVCALRMVRRAKAISFTLSVNVAITFGVCGATRSSELPDACITIHASLATFSWSSKGRERNDADNSIASVLGTGDAYVNVVFSAGAVVGSDMAAMGDVRTVGNDEFRKIRADRLTRSGVCTC
jgi:hypothetical protein